MSPIFNDKGELSNFVAVKRDAIQLNLEMSYPSCESLRRDDHQPKVHSTILPGT